jgi:hypothetical protein
MYGDFMALPPVEQRKAKHRIRQLTFDTESAAERRIRKS